MMSNALSLTQLPPKNCLMGENVFREIFVQEPNFVLIPNMRHMVKFTVLFLWCLHTAMQNRWHSNSLLKMQRKSMIATGKKLIFCINGSFAKELNDSLKTK